MKRSLGSQRGDSSLFFTGGNGEKEGRDSTTFLAAQRISSQQACPRGRFG